MSINANKPNYTLPVPLEWRNI